MRLVVHTSPRNVHWNVGTFSRTCFGFFRDQSLCSMTEQFPAGTSESVSSTVLSRSLIGMWNSVFQLSSRIGDKNLRQKRVYRLRKLLHPYMGAVLDGSVLVAANPSNYRRFSTVWTLICDYHSLLIDASFQASGNKPGLRERLLVAFESHFQMLTRFLDALSRATSSQTRQQEAHSSFIVTLWNNLSELLHQLLSPTVTTHLNSPSFLSMKQSILKDVGERVSCPLLFSFR